MSRRWAKWLRCLMLFGAPKRERTGLYISSQTLYLFIYGREWHTLRARIMHIISHRPSSPLPEKRTHHCGPCFKVVRVDGGNSIPGHGAILRHRRQHHPQQSALPCKVLHDYPPICFYSFAESLRMGVRYPGQMFERLALRISLICFSALGLIAIAPVLHGAILHDTLLNLVL
jgi:hypothetical protein